MERLRVSIMITSRAFLYGAPHVTWQNQTCKARDTKSSASNCRDASLATAAITMMQTKAQATHKPLRLDNDCNGQHCSSEVCTTFVHTGGS